MVTLFGFLQVPPVGLFSQGPSLSFTPQRTRTAVAMNLQFKTYMVLSHADAVFLKLPGFSMSGSAVCVCVCVCMCVYVCVYVCVCVCVCECECV